MVTKKTLKTVFKLRRDLAANWTTEDPVLQLGEPGFAYDTNVLKIGDGTKKWSQLPAIAATESSLAAIATTGNINDLIQTDGEYVVFDCGDASTIIS